MNDIIFYLLYGEDKGILNKEIDNLKKKLSINEDNTIYYDLENINDIIEEALTISMFSSNKFIIIDSTSYLSEKKEILKNLGVKSFCFDISSDEAAIDEIVKTNNVKYIVNFAAESHVDNSIKNPFIFT